MVYLIDWTEAYLDNCQERFVNGTYKGKRDIFKRFFKEVSPETPVSDFHVPDNNLFDNTFKFMTVKGIQPLWTESP